MTHRAPIRGHRGVTSLERPEHPRNSQKSIIEPIRHLVGSQVELPLGALDVRAETNTKTISNSKPSGNLREDSVHGHKQLLDTLIQSQVLPTCSIRSNKNQAESNKHWKARILRVLTLHEEHVVFLIVGMHCDALGLAQRRLKTNKK